MSNIKCYKCDFKFNTEEGLQRHNRKCIYYRYSCLNMVELNNKTIDDIILISNLLLLNPSTPFISKNNILINLNLRIKFNKKNTDIINCIYNIIENLDVQIFNYSDIVETISKIIAVPIESIIAINNLFYTV